jgi:hypothetical protein
LGAAVPVNLGNLRRYVRGGEEGSSRGPDAGARGRSERLTIRGSGVTASTWSGRFSQTVLGVAPAGCAGGELSPESRHAARRSAIDSLSLSISEDMAITCPDNSIF